MTLFGEKSKEAKKRSVYVHKLNTLKNIVVSKAVLIPIGLTTSKISLP